jgi:phosphatidylglycerophosphate synthase
VIHAAADTYFVYALGCLAVLAAGLYGVRLATRGAAHSERVSKIGGTAMLGQGLMDWTYWSVEPVVKGLVALGVTPNGLTYSALVTGVGAGIAMAFGWFGLACLLATFSTIGDILDGQVARATGTGSDKGELLDAVVDRYTELAFVGGTMIFLRDSAWQMAVALSAVASSFMVSYASAKAEALQVTPPRGIMRRHERAVYFIAGAGISAMVGPWMHERWGVPWYSIELVALAVVGFFGNLAAITRFVRIARALDKRPQ